MFGGVAVEPPVVVGLVVGAAVELSTMSLIPSAAPPAAKVPVNAKVFFATVLFLIKLATFFTSAAMLDSPAAALRVGLETAAVPDCATDKAGPANFGAVEAAAVAALVAVAAAGATALAIKGVALAAAPAALRATPAPPGINVAAASPTSLAVTAFQLPCPLRAFTMFSPSTNVAKSPPPDISAGFTVGLLLEGVAAGATGFGAGAGLGAVGLGAVDCAVVGLTTTFSPAARAALSARPINTFLT
jgi:hypothetical protein